MQAVHGKRFPQCFLPCSAHKSHKLLLQCCELLCKIDFPGKLKHCNAIKEQGPEQAVHHGEISIRIMLFRCKDFYSCAVLPYNGYRILQIRSQQLRLGLCGDYRSNHCFLIDRGQQFFLGKRQFGAFSAAFMGWIYEMVFSIIFCENNGVLSVRRLDTEHRSLVWTKITAKLIPLYHFLGHSIPTGKEPQVEPFCALQHGAGDVCAVLFGKQPRQLDFKRNFIILRIHPVQLHDRSESGIGTGGFEMHVLHTRILFP